MCDFGEDRSQPVLKFVPHFGTTTGKGFSKSSWLDDYFGSKSGHNGSGAVEGKHKHVRLDFTFSLSKFDSVT